ncbi:MAG: serine hydrolase domain-containing protein [Pseudomonadota bacterium]
MKIRIDASCAKALTGAKLTYSITVLELTMADKWLLACFALFAWATASASETPQSLEELDSALEALVADAVLPGASIAVVEDGETVLVRAYGKADVANGVDVSPSTLFKAGSTSKNLTSLLAIILAEEGAFDIDAPLSQYLPDLGLDNPFTDHPILIAHLLEHTAGIEGSTYNEYATSSPDKSPTDYAYEMAPKLKVRWEPGFYFSYANSGHTLVAAAIESATGETYDDLVRSRIFEPLGMGESTFLWSEVDQTRVSESYADDGITTQPVWVMEIRPSGSLVSTASDLAKIVELYAARGGTLVSEDSVERMERPVYSAAARAGMEKGGYGFGNFGFFEGEHLFQGHWGATEGFRTHLGYHIDTQSGYVVMANSDDGTSHRIRGLIAGYLTRNIAPPEEFNELGPESDPTRWVGWYQPFTEDMLLRSWIWKTFGSVHVSASEGSLTFDPVIPFLPQRTVNTAGGALYTEDGVSIPTIALVESASRRPVLISGQGYSKSKWLVAVVPFYLVAAGLIAALLATAHVVVWLPMMVFGRINREGAAVRVFALVSGASLLGLAYLFVNTGLLGDWNAITAMGSVSAASLTLLVLSLVGPVTSVAGLVSVHRLSDAPKFKVYALAVAVALSVVWLILALSGWVPLVTFRG